jgi:hypothetical protein
VIRPWIGVDLDGTLAEYDGWQGPAHIGKPIPRMAERVKQWLAEGKHVKIFTARVYSDGTPERDQEVLDSVGAINRWCREHVGQALNITCVKNFAMVELWDDRAIQVELNTGRRADGKP